MIFEIGQDGINDFARYGMIEAPTLGGLARILVNGGTADQQWEAHSGGKCALRGNSLHGLSAVETASLGGFSTHQPGDSDFVSPALRKAIDRRVAKMAARKSAKTVNPKTPDPADI
jgi:hypothetical protein